MKRLLLLLLATLLVFASCTDANPGQSGEQPTDGSGVDATEGTDGGAESVPPADFAQSDADMFTDRDLDDSYDEARCVRIELQGDGAAASGEGVTVDGSTVTITKEATYLITGTLNDGMLVVDAPDTAKLQLIFDGVSITSESCAPLYIIEADKVFLTLAAGSENTLVNGGTFTAIDENNVDGAVFSKQDLTLNGSGSLTVTSPAGHGIVCKDDLVFTGGTYTVNSASHGLDANDSVRVKGASITVRAGKDGIHAENTEDNTLGFFYASDGTLDIEAEGDGISAGYYLQVMSGTFTVLSGGGSENAQKQSSDYWGGFMGGDMPGGGGGMGGRPMGRSTTGNSDANLQKTAAVTDTVDDGSTSMKGLKSAGEMFFAGGSLTVNSADDAIHSDTSLTVSGGTFEIASGDDAFHAEENLTISAGTINVTESYEGLEALHIKIQGGDIKLIASDDGLNAAGGTDTSGTTGGRDGMFGGMGGGGMPGGMGNSGNGSIEITGGTLYVNASGDGIDANGTLAISGGHTTVVGPTQGDTATLDYDSTATITGGTFIGTGASGMAQTFSDSEQGVIAVSVGNQSAGTEILLEDADSKELIRYTPELNYAVVILSSPELKSGETYTITVGSQSADFAAN